MSVLIIMWFCSGIAAVFVVVLVAALGLPQAIRLIVVILVGFFILLGPWAILSLVS